MRAVGRIAMITGLLALLPSGVIAQTLSRSKLSAHLINSYTTAASNIVARQPRVLKILDLGSGMSQAARAYKSDTTNGNIVLGTYTPKSYTITDQPAAHA